LQQGLSKAPFKHDPAGNGDCASCHSAHQANQPALLLKEPGKLCFDCHEEKDIAAVKAHADPNKSCTACHDPHRGQDKFLLKPEALKAAGGASLPAAK